MRGCVESFLGERFQRSAFDVTSKVLLSHSSYSGVVSGWSSRVDVTDASEHLAHFSACVRSFG